MRVPDDALGGALLKRPRASEPKRRNVKTSRYLLALAQVFGYHLCAYGELRAKGHQEKNAEWQCSGSVDPSSTQSSEELNSECLGDPDLYSGVTDSFSPRSIPPTWVDATHSALQVAPARVDVSLANCEPAHRSLSPACSTRGMVEG